MNNEFSTENLYTAFIEQVEEYAIFAMDLNGHICTWNMGAERIKGYPEEEVIGQHYGMLFPENYQKEGKPEKELEIARQKGIYKAEDWRRRKDGSIFWARVVLTLVHGEDGKPIGFTKITNDRSWQKKHEQEKERYNQIINSIPQMIWTATPQGDIDWINEWFYRFVGQEPDKQIGWNWISNIHPDDVAHSLQAWSHSLSTAEPYQVEQRIKHVGGDYVTHLVKAFPIKDSQGKIIWWLGSSVDIEAQKRLQESQLLNQQLEEKVKERAYEIVSKNEELQHMNQTLNTLVHIAAHDLRSPVNNLKGLLALLNTEAQEGRAKEVIGLINTSAERLSRTIHGLISIIQTQHSQTLQPQYIELEELLKQVMYEFKEVLEVEHGKLLTDFTALPTLQYNDTYLESILRNLISNAIKYHSPKRPLEIVITSEQAGDWNLLTIKDNGIGMDLERVKDKLFRPFIRFTEQAEGTGVGLHLIKNMIEKDGGHITVESQPEVGTTFRLFLKKYE